MVLLQLGRGCSTAETRKAGEVHSRPSGFNWAAVFQPRKLVGVGILVAYGFRLQLGRGLSTAETYAEHIHYPYCCRLQLGRGCSTAETNTTILSGHTSIDASIWPRSFNRGNVSILTTVLLVDSCSHPIVYSSELSLQGLKSILAELEAQWQRIQRIHTHT